MASPNPYTWASRNAYTIVNGRLKCIGMRRLHDGAQHVLNLRTPVKSNRWDAPWSVYQGAPIRRAA